MPYLMVREYEKLPKSYIMYSERNFMYFSCAYLSY